MSGGEELDKPTSSRGVPLFRGSSSSSIAFDDIQQQLNSIEAEEDDDFWHASHQKGFNFEEDGPTMVVAPPLPVDKASKKIEFRPKLQNRPRPGPALAAGGKTPAEAVEDIFRGNGYSLEHFRSKEAKDQLIEAALEIGETSTIQVVVLFLRNTLKPSLFQQELMQRPQMLYAYLNYLRECGEHSALIEQLSLSGHTDEAGRHRYRQIATTDDLKARTRTLAGSVNTHFLGCADQPTIRNQLELLELQTKLQEIDGVTLQVEEKILGSSLFDTVRYCARYHSGDPEAHFASPAYLRQAFKVAPDQFAYACITGFAEAQNYVGVESFLESRNWLGKKKLSSPIGFDKIVQILHRHKAPAELLEKYIAHVDNVEDRMELAKAVGAMNALVNCYVQTKNRSELEKLLAKLPRESTAALLAQSSLNNPAIKWSN